MHHSLIHYGFIILQLFWWIPVVANISSKKLDPCWPSLNLVDDKNSFGVWTDAALNGMHSYIYYSLIRPPSTVMRYYLIGGWKLIKSKMHKYNKIIKDCLEPALPCMSSPTVCGDPEPTWRWEVQTVNCLGSFSSGTLSSRARDKLTFTTSELALKSNTLMRETEGQSDIAASRMNFIFWKGA